MLGGDANNGMRTVLGGVRTGELREWLAEWEQRGKSGQQLDGYTFENNEGGWRGWNGTEKEVRLLAQVCTKRVTRTVVDRGQIRE